MVGAVAAVAVFLAFLFFAVQLVINLYATTTVTGLAYDAARRVAAAPVTGRTAKTQSEAGQDLRDALGDYGRNVDLDWSESTPGVVRLHVTAPNPNFLIFGGVPVGFDTVDRTIEVRRETVR